ncbi:MAG TPA: DUF3298 domain-containing protein [Streptosporangiaceae bacterium]|nr:DUF3298 domain-containing protein [Streptosporangiaceae bacterium]
MTAPPVRTTRTGGSSLRFPICLVLVGSLLGSACTRQPGSAPAASPGATSAGRATVTMARFSPPQARRYTKFTATIPVLHDPRDAHTAQLINSDLRAVIGASIKEHLKDEREVGFEPGTFAVRSIVRYFRFDLFSVEMRTTSTTPMSMQPAMDSITRNYWLADGRVITFDDLFLDDADHLWTIAHRIVEQIPRGIRFREHPEQLMSEVVDIVYDSNYLIADRGLRFVFPPCQIGPCTSGYIETIVSFRDLARVIDPEGPLGRFRNP